MSKKVEGFSPAHDRASLLLSQAEKRLGIRLADWLPQQLNDGLKYSVIAKQLGISTASVPHWMEYLGYEKRTVWFKPDEQEIRVVRKVKV